MYLGMSFQITNAHCINVGMFPFQNELRYATDLKIDNIDFQTKEINRFSYSLLASFSRTISNNKKVWTSFGIVAEKSKDCLWRGKQSTIFSISFRNPRSSKWSASSSISIFSPINRTDKPDLFSTWSNSLPGVATIICKNHTQKLKYNY